MVKSYKDTAKKMKQLRRYVAIYMALLICSPVGHVMADDVGCKKYFDDTSDKYALGRVPMGGDLRSIPGIGQRWAECLDAWDKQWRGMEISKSASQFVDETGRDGFCRFTDMDGVTYSFISVGAADTSGPFLMYKQEVLDLSKYHGHLLAGIIPGDSYANVFRKLKKLPKDFPEWTFSQPSLNGPYAVEPVAETTFCLRGSNGGTWGVQLRFDRLGRIKSIATLEDWGGGDDVDP